MKLFSRPVVFLFVVCAIQVAALPTPDVDKRGGTSLAMSNTASGRTGNTEHLRRCQTSFKGVPAIYRVVALALAVRRSLLRYRHTVSILTSGLATVSCRRDGPPLEDCY